MRLVGHVSEIVSGVLLDFKDPVKDGYPAGTWEIVGPHKSLFGNKFMMRPIGRLDLDPVAICFDATQFPHHELNVRFPEPATQ